ncbi:cation efflux family-domain-containing protein [Filobasidium floriforme]|uniref:cation efflux family-domain-containing protein n=1 Tax=Filobasidium floriforme TaxID=5210 RepID=UPI001E8E5A37|nr:cation efflux family-domain-containing protein [Filobasidium floriforme]KAH8084246.1 cation efflux family-domain-containing protein [Filobasidium floriforme]
MADSIELPVLTHLGHSKPRDRSASKTSLRMPDVVAPSATMGAASGSGSLGNIEAQEIPGITLIDSRDSGEADPLLLRDKIVSEDELNEIRNRKKGKGKKISDFYAGQNEHIGNLLKPLKVHTEEAIADEADNAKSVRWAIRLSLYCNFALAGLQLYAAISSLSLSLFATCIDAVFDPFANILLNVLHKRSLKADEKKWPMGGSRGNIVYGALMGMVNLILIVESIRSLATRESDEETNEIYIPALVAVGIAFLTKLSLFIFCFSIRKKSSQVQVLYEDHRNDLFVNGYIRHLHRRGWCQDSLVGKYTAAFQMLRDPKVNTPPSCPQIDPMGAMIIASAIIIAWSRTIFEQFKLLAGIAAPVDFQQLVIYKAMTFNPAIKQIDTCRIYHSGPNYFVEIDIVMDGDMPLWRAHDIAQDLQDQVEKLPDVDRCFVHIDHETDHKPEHRRHL